MLGLFKKRKTWEKVDRYIKRAFDRVKNDIHHVYSWIHYLKHKDEVNDHEHSQMNREMGENRVAIHYLSSKIQELTKELEELKQGQNNVIMQPNIQKIAQKGQLKDISRTSPGLIEDIKGTTQDMSLIGKKSDLTGAQSELLQLLYHSDRPLGYNEIAKRLQKKPKSIRNLIYEIRDKGIGIRDKPIGIREKGFFLDEKLKIEISGR